MDWDVIGGLLLLCLGLPMLICAAMDTGLHLYCWMTGKRYEG